MAEMTMAKGEWPRKPRKAGRSWLEERVAVWLEQSKLPAPVREFKFAPQRQFRFDFAWPARGLAVECEGGIWSRGAHTRGLHFAQDCTKYNLAAMLGWRVLRLTEVHLRDGSAFELLQSALTTEIRYVPTVLTELEEG
jgi:hypothetical protein